MCDLKALLLILIKTPLEASCWGFALICSWEHCQECASSGEAKSLRVPSPQALWLNSAAEGVSDHRKSTCLSGGARESNSTFTSVLQRAAAHAFLFASWIILPSIWACQKMSGCFSVLCQHVFWALSGWTELNILCFQQDDVGSFL